MKNKPPASSVTATTDDANTASAVGAVGAEGSEIGLLAVRTGAEWLALTRLKP
jgi:hypothetical protein